MQTMPPSPDKRATDQMRSDRSGEGRPPDATRTVAVKSRQRASGSPRLPHHLHAVLRRREPFAVPGPHTSRDGCCRQHLCARAAGRDVLSALGAACLAVSAPGRPSACTGFRRRCDASAAACAVVEPGDAMARGRAPTILLSASGGCGSPVEVPGRITFSRCLVTRKATVPGSPGSGSAASSVDSMTLTQARLNSSRPSRQDRKPSCR